MKRYEECYDQRLVPNTCTIIRVDGRAFHTYTKQRVFKERCVKTPFSKLLHSAMLEAAEMTAKEMSGFKLAYTQSDECTFLLTDFDTHQTEPWFGGRVNKVVSIAASAYTAYFNRYMNIVLPSMTTPAMFDARAYVMPIDDAPNLFVWRQRDWERNSLSMLAQHHFSHNSLQGKNSDDMHQMLHEIGVNWATNLEPWQKNGTFITRDGTLINDKLLYNEILSKILPPPVEQ